MKRFQRSFPTCPFSPNAESRPSTPGVELRAANPPIVSASVGAQEKSAAPSRCESPPASVRSSAITPTELRPSTSRRRRTAENPVAGDTPSNSCWRMWKAPTSVRPSLPVMRAPPTMGMISPSSESPIRRLKNRKVSGGSNGRLVSPTWKSPAFSRKNSRCSGKKSSKRVRFTCCSSASTCAKSVFTVTSRFRLDPSPTLASSPRSAVPARSSPSPVTPATPKGFSLMRPPGSAFSSPWSTP